MTAWHWPQWIEAGLLALSVIGAVSNHGKPRGNYDGPSSFLAAVFLSWLLWCGGFWG
jgi:hypothetical protein